MALCELTRKNKIQDVSLPSLGGSRNQSVDKVEHLWLILDQKLTWSPKIEKSVRKTCKTQGICIREKVHVGPYEVLSFLDC